MTVDELRESAVGVPERPAEQRREAIVALCLEFAGPLAELVDEQATCLEHFLPRPDSTAALAVYDAVVAQAREVLAALKVR